jgi:PAS domain S-box-containing protein
MGEALSEKEGLRGLIEALHAGADPEDLKQRFKDVLKGVGPTDIARIEEELVAEGLPREEIQRLCDLHLVVFRESLEADRTLAPAGHPIHILMQEHSALLRLAEELRDVAQEMGEETDPSHVPAQVERIGILEEHLRESESHYLREENVLFPYLEKHGITQPPAIMWMEHNEIRQTKKNLYESIAVREGMAPQDFAEGMEEAALSLVDLLSSHFAKENDILFPAALEVIGEDEWKEIRRQFDELGYCCFTPEPAGTTAEVTDTRAAQPEAEGAVRFETGSLSKEELAAILDTLPVDITFVDKEDKVRYFSKPEERIFARTEAVIGREVQQCHPQKSIHVVNQILDDFRSGRRDVADFWIDFGGRFVYIRYFPVRNSTGDYLGCLEVTQDITDVKGLEGEKRLL